MKKTEVLALLKKNSDQRGIDHWNKKPRGLTSFGIGLTKVRKLAKEIGRDRKLAGQLWATDNYEARIIGLLIDDPKEMTAEQAEQQVDELHHGMLSHVFSSCDATLSKTKFAFELADQWTHSSDPVRRRCGYGLIYELSKKNPKGMDDAYLIALVNRIRKTIAGEEMWVQEAMTTALLGIGKRNQKLNKAAIAAAKAIGHIEIDYGDDNQCESMDLMKHLTSDHLKKKFADPK
ncbi:DNA alkylation repair enzyme [Rubripirellula tenax]|uniref:DNA alkylation repair enzyme n=1 Tax=Rubripirellula tenax TaxID=2528015 RepID=A0A5C6FE38_9BACT|nr:DNA alkylation repair protein [Rubripirellula tenax]TWU59012.1 DNA alkylation repair enzyme [Rubripirellula tenax]